MSKHVVLKTIFVSLLGVSFGYGLTRYMSANTIKTPRFIASIPLRKLGIDQVSFDYIQIKIENVSVADKRENTSIVKAKITALKDIPTALNYKWVLGKDVTTADAIDGFLEPMHSGDVKEIEFRVQNYSKEFQTHVSIAVTGFLADHPVNREVIISSRPEDSFEYVVQQAYIQEQLQKQSSGQIKKLSNGKPDKSDKFRPDRIVR